MIFFDKNGVSFEVIKYKPELHPLLVEMYALFTPKAKFQGLPPIEADKAGKWIQLLIDKGENFLALRRAHAIGHSVLIPDYDRRDGDFQIFVDQASREVGVGSALAREAIASARRLGLKKMFLTVEAYNYRAIWLYRKFEFQFCDGSPCDSERVMALNLREK